MNKKKIFKIALVGKKNVGKSSFLNLFAKKNRAIVDDYPGLTRDILEVEVRNFGIHAIIVDLPGLDIVQNPIEILIKERLNHYLSTEVDLILHIMEPPAPSSFDYEIREFAKRNWNLIPMIQVVNKIDSKEKEYEFMPAFYEENFQPIPISVKSRYNIKQLAKKILEKNPKVSLSNKNLESDETEKKLTTVSDFQKEDLRICIVGKPNVGKSTLFNFWVGSDKSLVSDVPGTTRDTIDSIIHFFGKTIRILDTAGLRRKKSLEDHIEFISSRRTRRAILDSDVVVQLISAVDGITQYDKKIVSLIEELNKPMILFVNKWDSIPEKTANLQNQYKQNLITELPYLKNVPIFFGSALTKKRAGEPLKKVLDIYEKSKIHIKTSVINKYIEAWLHKYPHNQKFKVYYVSQIESSIPYFVLFCNNKKLIHRNFITFLENRIREEFKLEGIPIRIKLKDKKEE